MVTLSMQEVQTCFAPGAGVTVHTAVTLPSTAEDALPLLGAGHQALGAALLALPSVQVIAHFAACAEVPVETGVTIRLALCAVVYVWGAGAIVTTGAGGQANANLPHPIPLQVEEESGLAGQATIGNGAVQTPSLAALIQPRSLFMLPVPGGVLLTVSIFDTVQEQNKGEHLQLHSNLDNVRV